jgi:ADP-ribose pyrophosphatase
MLIAVETLEKTRMKISDLKIHEKKAIYRGFVKLDKLILQHRRFDGAWSPIIERELVERPPAVAVLLLDPPRQKIILIEQFRVGAINDRISPWLIEIVAGILPEGKEPTLQAKQEIFEEVGLNTENMHFIMRYWVSPGASNEEVYLYWAKVDSSLAQGIHGAVDENEDIKVHVMSYQEAFALYQAGQIRNGFAIIALQWLALNHEKLA